MGFSGGQILDDTSILEAQILDEGPPSEALIGINTKTTALSSSSHLVVKVVQLTSITESTHVDMYFNPSRTKGICCKEFFKVMTHYYLLLQLCCSYIVSLH